MDKFNKMEFRSTILSQLLNNKCYKYSMSHNLIDIVTGLDKFRCVCFASRFQMTKCVLIKLENKQFSTFFFMLFLLFVNVIIYIRREHPSKGVLQCMMETDIYKKKGDTNKKYIKAILRFVNSINYELL